MFNGRVTGFSESAEECTFSKIGQYQDIWNKEEQPSGRINYDFVYFPEVTVMRIMKDPSTYTGKKSCSPSTTCECFKYQR